MKHDKGCVHHSLKDIDGVIGPKCTCKPTPDDMQAVVEWAAPAFDGVFLSDDYLYIGDSGEEYLVRMEDLDNDGDCHDQGEHGIYFDGDHLRDEYTEGVGSDLLYIAEAILEPGWEDQGIELALVRRLCDTLFT